MIRTMILAGVLALVAAPVMAAQLDGKEVYGLLFRNGTLDTVQPGQMLVYGRVVQSTLKPELAERDTGDIALTVKEDDGRTAELDFRQGGKHRGIGSFPADVGNPMIMYFYETVVRDMAESAGGSPFYIRNRVKDALVQPSEVETGETVVNGATVPTRVIRLHPFANDRNRARMMGWEDLELTVTMSDQVPGWYVGLVAEAPGKDGAPPVYRSALTFRAERAAE